MSTRTDTERLDWLQENGMGTGIIEDDNGHWAVSNTGTQNVPEGEGPQDIWTSFFVEASEWHPTLREAIDAAMGEADS